MTIAKSHRVSRYTLPGLLPGLRLGTLALGVLLGSSAAPALGSPPQGWETGANDSLLTALLKLIGIPLLVIAVVTLLVYLPGMIRGQSREPALAFSERSEWFGGPRAGVDAADADDADDAATAARPEASAKGGASARW